MAILQGISRQAYELCFLELREFTHENRRVQQIL